MIRVIGSSHIGMVRKENQDAFLLNQLADSGALLVVCDGMGGIQGGKTASDIACKTFFDCVSQGASDSLADLEVYDLFNEAITLANKKVYSKSRDDLQLMGMGTTLVAVLILDKKAYFANVGDSRAYILSGAGIDRVTRDHSVVQELVDMGSITEKQAKNHLNKNIITRAVGVELSVEFDFYVRSLKADDIVLLCSDGLTNFVDDLEIQFEFANSKVFENVPQKLIELANTRGGKDNITVLAARI